VKAAWSLRQPGDVFDPAVRASLNGLAGDHRVQRIPATEKRGRRHSSHILVVVLDGKAPARDSLDRSDVRIDTYRSSGAGGQHRNKTDSAVRLTHAPTGTVVTATEERSQHANREVAWRRLHEALDQQHRSDSHDLVNGQRRATFDDSFRSWVWCGWRDEVKRPDGTTSSMRRALAGRLTPLLA